MGYAAFSEMEGSDFSICYSFKIIGKQRKGSKRRFHFCGVVLFAYFSLEYSSFLMALYQYYNSVTE